MRAGLRCAARRARCTALRARSTGACAWCTRRRWQARMTAVTHLPLHDSASGEPRCSSILQRCVNKQISMFACYRILRIYCTSAPRRAVTARPPRGRGRLRGGCPIYNKAGGKFSESLAAAPCRCSQTRRRAPRRSELAAAVACVSRPQRLF